MKIIGLADGITQIVTDSPLQNDNLVNNLGKANINYECFKNSIFVDSTELKETKNAPLLSSLIKPFTHA